MAENPESRRRADKSTRPSKPLRVDDTAEGDATEGRPAPSNSPSEGGSRFKVGVGWALVTGLAVGFAVGREAHRFGLSDGREADDGSKSSFIAAESNTGSPQGAGRQAYKSSAEFPSGWVKDSDLANGATLFAGLTDPQKVMVMQALNERQCTCGCSFGTLAECLHKDPNCPNSPAIAKMSVDLVKQGKSLDQILAAIDDRQKGNSKPAAAAPAEPPTPKYIEVAAWNPRKGPKDPKVTVVLFSDFQ